MRLRWTTFIALLSLFGAIGFLVRFNFPHLERADYISSLQGRAATDEVAAAHSGTGYANGQRELILPDRNEDSFQWIAQSQQMLALKEWRVRRVDYDNAPFGRDVNAASPYRWWLGLVAFMDHFFSGRPVGLSVEHAALLADPLLQGLLLVVGALLVAWKFGARASALFATGFIVVFPLATEFFPGLPDPHGLAIGLAVASVLGLAAGMGVLYAGGTIAGTAQTQARRWFFAAGCLGGAGLWVDVSTEAPVLLGLCFGALLTAVISRCAEPDKTMTIPPWRSWALGGAGSVLVAYGAEYLPSHAGGWRLESIHPLYGLAWLGFGELLVQLVPKIQRRNWVWSTGEVSSTGLAVLAVAAFPIVASRTGGAGFLGHSLNSEQLTHLPDGTTASSVAVWITRDGMSIATIATLAPLAMVATAGWLIFRAKTDAAERVTLGLVIGPVLIAGVFACRQLSWWSVLDGLVLVLLIVVSAARRSEASWRGIWFWLLPAGVWMVAGLVQLWPHRSGSREPVLTNTEAELLIERDAAHWLALHSGNERPVVYAPPNETTTLVFYGNLRGIGTYCLDNDAAVQATLKVASAGSLQEARLLLQGRDVRYIVLPSWDAFFEDYARLYQNKNAAHWDEFFLASLKAWRLPQWLRPLPYETPVIGGLGPQSVQILEIVGDQKPAVAASRLTECLLAIGENEIASRTVADLRKFPADIGAIAAEAQVMAALNDVAGFDHAVESLLLRLRGGADRYLPWDRRVSVAIVLARARRPELARVQVQQCAATFDEEKAGSLSTAALYNLLGLAHAYGVEIANAPARAWSLQLLPADMRARVK